METFFTPQIISIATVIGFLFGSLWYSPFLFFKAWLKGVGISKDQMPKRSKKYMAQVMAYTLLAHGAMASTLALLFDIAEVDSMKNGIYLGIFLAFGFIVTTKFIEMVQTVSGSHYEMKPQLNFLVNSGYYVCVMGVMSAAMFWASCLA